MNIRSKYCDVLPYFPDSIRLPLSRISKEEADRIQEIRLRIGRPVQVVQNGTAFTVTASGSLAPIHTAGIRTGRAEMDTLFRNLCSHSVHSCQSAIRQGYLTITGGSRAGLCGTAVMHEHGFETVRNIGSINLRIASERTGCADLLAGKLGEKMYTGLLIAGPPASGKTTILRDIARITGDRQRVCIMDERGEIAAVQNGIPQFSVGAQTDVFDGYPKAYGISVAVRVMSPELLICDEIGNTDETDALLQSLHTGVQIIATAHAASIAELYERPQILRLIRSGILRTAVLLGTGTHCGQASAIETLRYPI